MHVPTASKRLILTILAVLFLASCAPTRHKVTYDFECEGLVDPNQESAQLLTEGEVSLVSNGKYVLTNAKERDIVELANNQFKMLVFCENKSLVLNLVVPTGKELFVEEPSVTVLNTINQQENKFDALWSIPIDSETETEAVNGRLIGLESSPPATAYWEDTAYWGLRFDVSDKKHFKFVSSSLDLKVVVKLPVFRSKENETIKFHDVTVNVLVYEIHKYSRWIPLINF